MSAVIDLSVVTFTLALSVALSAGVGRLALELVLRWLWRSVTHAEPALQVRKTAQPKPAIGLTLARVARNR